MFKCFRCGSNMVWQSDFGADECGYDFEGIVSFYHCSSCNTTAEFVTDFTKEDE